ncbi:class I SAM-dependent methyltransferase [Nocardia sp. NPDC005978]|uniref:class I SAM-dependent methyltransferase n=1 Tax=Nocardia sp. NPDC005978 TaxID=3156725 RepID=UPI0033A6E768
MGSGRELRDTFDTAAALYRSARPEYPERLFDDLIAATELGAATRLLEIGCGPGIATVPMARRGYAITAVELGPALAEVARDRLAAFPSVEVITAPFEQWDPGDRRAFDLVYCATAWKWIDPAVRYRRAADLLGAGGHLAVWSAGHAFPPDFDPFFTEIQRVYLDIGEPDLPWPPPLHQADSTAAEMAESGLFDVTLVRPYLWSVTYTADTYLALLNTFSNHIAMQTDKRDHLYGEVRRLLANRADGTLVRHWGATLTIGRRRSTAG